MSNKMKVKQNPVDTKLIPRRVHLVCLRKCKSKQKLLYFDSNYFPLSYFENISFEVYGWLATFMRKINEWFILFDLCQCVHSLIGTQIEKNVWNCCLESMTIESIERTYYHSKVRTTPSFMKSDLIYKFYRHYQGDV